AGTLRSPGGGSSPDPGRRQMRRSVGRYAGLFATRQARLPALYAFAGRLSIGMIGLAIVLFVRQATGSIVRAGSLTAVFAFAGGVGSAAQGRLIDRFGQTRVLAVAGAAHAGGLLALVA